MSRAQGKKTNRAKSILIGLLTLTLILGGVGVGFVVAALNKVPNIDSSNIEAFAVSSSIYDQDGELVDKLQGAENREPVELQEISPHVIDALLSIEDQRFYKHFGVDPLRIMGAAVANIKQGHIAQGGSTLTQQLVKVSMLDPQDKTIRRKIQEAVIAVKVENDYTKDEILTFYLNTVYFGDGAYGIEAAAKNFFGKNAKDLTIDEAALLAGVIQNPYNHSPLHNPENAQKRRSTVLDAMVDFKKLTQVEADNLKNTPINIIEIEEETSDVLPYQSFVDHVVESAIENLGIEDDSSNLFTGGYKIYTTLDTDIQSNMEEVYNNSNNFPGSRGDSIVQSAMVVLDPKSGEIRALIGGRDQTGKRNFNRATQALRQPGSTFKPIASYAPALEKGYSPASVLDDFPIAYKTASGTQTIRNYSNNYRGLTPMRTSIKYSVNTTAVKMLQEIGIEEGFDFAKKLGISSLVSTGTKNDVGLSLALGGLTKGTSPLELTAAYAVFANGGVYIPPHCITRIEDSKGNVIWEDVPGKKVVMSPESAYLMNDMLQDVVNGGTGTNAKIPGRQVAGKTGTTSFNVDTWFVGYTPELVSSVWMGYDKTEKMSGVSGGGNCAPIWKKVMVNAHKDLPNTKFERPANIVSLTIDEKSGMRPSNLTPNSFRKSELFNKKFIPNGTSEVWVRASVCPASEQLRNDYCPEAVSKVFLKREKPWSTKSLPGNLKGITPGDANLEAPKGRCQIHNINFQGDADEDDESDTDSLSLSYQIVNQNQVGLSWNPSDSDNVSYSVMKSEFPDEAGSQIGGTSGTAFIDANVIPGVTYYYRVIAQIDNESITSNTVSVTIGGGDNGNEPNPKPDQGPEPALPPAPDRNEPAQGNRPEE